MAKLDLWQYGRPSAFAQIYELWYIVLFLVICLSVYRLWQTATFTYRIRTRYRDIPSLPRHWLWGNVVNGGEKMKDFKDRHPDYGFEEIWNELGRPSCFLLDLAPITAPFLLVAEPQIAEAVVQPSPVYKYSVPKSDTVAALKRLIGRDSIISQEGEAWKMLRKRFNKGFAPSHLHTLAPLVVSKTRTFSDRLRAAADSGQAFALKDFAQDLTTDIVTQLIIERDFQAQSTPAGQGHKSVVGLLTASRILSTLTPDSLDALNLLRLIDPVRPTKSWFYEQVFNRRLYAILSEQLDADRRASGNQKTSTKAIVQLALAGMAPDAELLHNTVSQIKSFLFAGQDTTATLVQWLCYELSKASHSDSRKDFLDKVKAEHDSVFGCGAFSALDLLEQPNKSEQILGHRLPYTTAFVKETLRLHPPAATARLPPTATAHSPPYTVDIDGKPTRVDGLRIYNIHWLIHRNPKVWGADAHEFRPERWLDEEYVGKLPVGAWRPFERGPRNCIGQELAMMEAKVVLCAVTRGFEFRKEGLDGLNGEPEVWNFYNVTSVPVDGMRMKVSVSAGR